jgi:SOS-response transcriptional repressor LexA
MTEKRRRGRPTVGERVPLGLRVTPEMKQRLDAAAKRSGRSQSQEAEMRLERSFDRDDLLPDLLSAEYGPATAGLLLALGLIMTNAGIHEHWTRSDFLAPIDDRWLEDPTAFDQAVRGAVAFLNAARPPGEMLKSKASPGLQFSGGMVKAIRRDASQDEPLGPRHLSLIRAMLGPIAKRMTVTAPRNPVRPTEERRVPLLTLDQAMELSMFKTWDPTRFADATLISPRFSCGPRSFALEVPNSDETPGLREGDILILDPDIDPTIADWVLAQIDGLPRFAYLITEKVSNDAPVLLTHGSQRKHYLGDHGGPAIRAVMTELCTRRNYAYWVDEPRQRTVELAEEHLGAQKRRTAGSET